MVCGVGVPRAGWVCGGCEVRAGGRGWSRVVLGFVVRRVGVCSWVGWGPVLVCLLAGSRLVFGCRFRAGWGCAFGVLWWFGLGWVGCAVRAGLVPRLGGWGWRVRAGSVPRLGGGGCGVRAGWACFLVAGLGWFRAGCGRAFGMVVAGFWALLGGCFRDRFGGGSCARIVASLGAWLSRLFGVSRGS